MPTPCRCTSLPGIPMSSSRPGQDKRFICQIRLGLHQTELTGTDFHSQTIQLFENMKSALAEAGASFENVIKFNVYVTDAASQLAPYREIRDRYVSVSTPPASTLIQVPRLALDGLLVEVEAIAFLPA